MKISGKIGKRAGIVMSLFLGIIWGIPSFAVESSSDTQTGETQAACGAKTDAKTKVLQEEDETPSSKSEDKGKSSAGSAKGSK